jgi:TPR repeat protein
MWRIRVWLSVSVVLLLCIPTARAAMTDAQAKALAVATYRHPRSKPGAAAYKQLVHAANDGVPAAEYWLGVLCNSRHRYARANYWLTKAAEQGVAGAENVLGINYDYGKGVSKDYARADYWYRKSAAQGNADAQINLASAYQYGEGVPQDYAQALYWYKKAAAQGSAIAQFNVGLAYDYGHGVPESRVEAAHWYRKAAVRGNADAQNNLGVDYAKGEGVPKSYTRAVYWYKKAAAGGDRRAEHNLAGLLAQEKAAQEQVSVRSQTEGVTRVF